MNTDTLGENILKRFGPASTLQMQEAIEEAGGREVFFAGVLNAAGRVETVRVCARGTDVAVTALFEGLQAREVVIHNHPSGLLEPSDADMELASMYSAHGHGVYIVDNEATRVYVVVEPFVQNVKHLDAQSLSGFFSPDGPLARALPDHEVRPQQTRMMERVVQAFNQDQIEIVEAPTGVGKTMAYLLPAALWAIRNKERVIISTRTINLQEQIVFKDIPLLQRGLQEHLPESRDPATGGPPPPFSACLVKGRGNYICLRRLDRALSEATLFDDEEMRKQLHAIMDWTEKTEDGSRSDLPFVPARELWEQVCSEADSCSMGSCPDQKRCFVGRARREIAKADLIVVNHHMLFSDLAFKIETEDFSAVGVLPAYRRVIFDEAHSIEDSATEYFGVSATQLGAVATLGRFYRNDRGRERGLLPLLKIRIIKECTQLSIQDFEEIQTLLDGFVSPGVAKCRNALESAFTALRILTAKQCGQIGRDVKWRLTQEVLDDSALRGLHQDHILPAVEEVRAMVAHCRKLLNRLKDIPPIPEQEEAPLYAEITQLRAYTGRLERIGNALAESTSEELLENTVRWIEIDARNEKIVRVVRCPLDVGKPLAEWVYENLKTVVMTSATLSIQHEFSYLFSRLGLDRIDAGRTGTLALDSPFDFEKQALLTVAADLPEPNHKDFLDESAQAIREVLQITRGHAFVLFTSFFALNHAFKELEEELRRAGITPLKQGQATRTQLLERFRSDAASVLFATDSFWKGVDVAGESLQCVILPKLPFRVPSEPILQARAEAIESKGGNSFMEYAVPQAVIKFRQGFGRLIRRKSDKGSIVVLDRRIVAKFYGKMFLQSLPPIQSVKGPKARVCEALKLFFEGENTPD
jgi:ATP-dependent DNA helicase DinG